MTSDCELGTNTCYMLIVYCEGILLNLRLLILFVPISLRTLT